MARPTNKEIRYKNVGRPSIMTEDVIGKLESIFRIDGTVSEACNYADIDPSTYYDHIKNNNAFSKRMKQAQDYPYILARKGLFKNVQNEDMRAIVEFLKKRDERYKDKSDIDTKADMTVDLSTATLEELWKIARGGK